MPTPLPPTHEGDFTFAQDEPFALAAGGLLGPVTLRYAWYGDLDRRLDRVILICHALSGSARAADWWGGLFGPGLPFDPARSCLLCVNILGSCYGSTGPTSIDPATGSRYGIDFPLVTIHDMVRAQALLLDHLGIDQLHAVIGGSIGGMQALAWATLFPSRVGRCIAIGASPLNAFALAMNHLQQQAIRLDPAWRGGRYAPHEPPLAGLALARAIATCTYKCPELFQQRFGRRPNRTGEDPRLSLLGRFDVGGYLDYQGEVFHRRFDANSYLVISRAMDAFELALPGEDEAAALGAIEARVTLVGISSDWLFPPGDVRALGERMRGLGVDARYAEQTSPHGHDGFLADAADLAPVLSEALEG
jgi:homoserine O-acetyltransferase